MTKKEFFSLVSKAIGLPGEAGLDMETSVSEQWDSLSQIGLLAMLDKEFSVSLSMDELASVKTLGDIVQILATKGKALDDRSYS